MSIRIILVIATTAVLAAGCSSSPPVATSTNAVGIDTSRLFSTTWQLRTLAGQPAPLGAGGRPATLILGAADHRVSGFGGCNRFLGSYSLVGDSVDFKTLAMTKMACEQGNDLEVRYTGILEQVTKLRLGDSTLDLLVADSVAASFRAGRAGARGGARGRRAT